MSEIQKWLADREKSGVSDQAWGPGPQGIIPKNTVGTKQDYQKK